MEASQLNQDYIIETVMTYFDAPKDRVYSRCRKRDVTKARQVTMHFLRLNTPLTIKTIGKIFDRDHSSVCYATATVSDLMATDKGFKQDIQAIEQLIHN